MSYFRPGRLLARLNNQALNPRVYQVHSYRSFSVTSRSSTTASSKGYGDEGDPKSEKPQEQGSQSETHHKAEHPGPTPPSEGHNAGSATKATSRTKDPSEASASSGGSRSKEAKETGSSPTGGAVGSNGGESTTGSKDGVKPKISDKKTPGGGDAEKQAEVEQHNREFEQRYDRAPKAEDDKVDKRFWSGHGGVDNNP